MPPPLPDSLPSELDALLGVLERQSLGAAVALMKSGQRRVAPSGLGAAKAQDGTWTLVLLPVLDLQQRFEALRTAVAATQAEGFVFLYDGFIDGLDGRLDALLLVTSTATWARAQAAPYRWTVNGLQIFDPVPAPATIADAYRTRVFVEALSIQTH